MFDACEVEKASAGHPDPGRAVPKSAALRQSRVADFARGAMGQICSCFSEGNIAAEAVPVPVMAAAAPPVSPTKRRNSSVHKYAPKVVQEIEAKASEQHDTSMKNRVQRRKSIDAIFTIVDKNGDDCVSKRELKNAIKSQGPEFATRLGMKHGLRDVDKWFHDAGGTHDHMLSRDEFCKMIETQASPKMQRK